MIGLVVLAAVVWGFAALILDARQQRRERPRRPRGEWL